MEYSGEGPRQSGPTCVAPSVITLYLSANSVGRCSMARFAHTLVICRNQHKASSLANRTSRPEKCIVQCCFKALLSHHIVTTRPVGMYRCPGSVRTIARVVPVHVHSLA